MRIVTREGRAVNDPVGWKSLAVGRGNADDSDAAVARALSGRVRFIR